MNDSNDTYYHMPERRHARSPRRREDDRRHRIRTESLISDCRTKRARRKEDEDGFVEISTLYSEAERTN